MSSPTRRHGSTPDAYLSQLANEVEAFGDAKVITYRWSPHDVNSEVADV